MSCPLGHSFGGIRTLADLRARCLCDGDADADSKRDRGCWHLLAADGSRLRRAVSGDVPRVFVGAYRQTPFSARRAAVMLRSGRDLPAGVIVAACLRAWDCVNPAHLRQFSPREHGQHLKRHGLTKSPAHMAAAAHNGRTRRGLVLTDELAQWIRESPQSGVVVARVMGLRLRHVYDVRQGKIWAVKSTEAPLSAFSLLVRTLVVKTATAKALARLGIPADTQPGATP